jgi:hypothetical protein
VVLNEVPIVSIVRCGLGEWRGGYVLSIDLSINHMAITHVGGLRMIDGL